MMGIKIDCPHCNHKIFVKSLQRVFRPSKWIRCSSCGESSTFDFYSKLGLFWTCVFWMIWISILFLRAFIHDIFFVESIVIGAVLMISLLYYAHISTLSLRKIGRRKEDGSPHYYETKMTLIAMGVAVVFALWGYLTVLVGEVAFGIVTINSQMLIVEKRIAEEKKFENAFLSEEKFQKKSGWYSQRKGPWSRKCEQQKRGYYCRLVSRVASFRGQMTEEKTFLEKACNKGDLLGCYRLFSLGVDSGHGKQLIESCLNPQNKQNAYCGHLGKILYKRGDVNNALLVYENTCIKHKQYCNDFSRLFSAEKYTSNHENACREGVQSSCEALNLAKTSRDTASVFSKGDSIVKAVTLGNRKIVERLISQGADIHREDNRWNTPLHLAVKFGDISLVDLLLSKGAKINTVNIYGQTPLMTAVEFAEKGDKKIVKKLLDKGAEINMFNNFGQTALTLSSGRRDTDLFNEILFQDTQLYLNYKYSNLNSVRKIIRSGHYNSVKALFNHYDSGKIFDKVKPITLIWDALSHSSKETINVLFEELEKNDITLAEYNDTILEAAYLRGNQEIINALKRKKFITPRSLLLAVRIAFYRYVHFRSGNS